MDQLSSVPRRTNTFLINLSHTVISFNLDVLGAAETCKDPGERAKVAVTNSCYGYCTYGNNFLQKVCDCQDTSIVVLNKLIQPFQLIARDRGVLIAARIELNIRGFVFLSLASLETKEKRPPTRGVKVSVSF